MQSLLHVGKVKHDVGWNTNPVFKKRTCNKNWKVILFIFRSWRGKSDGVGYCLHAWPLQRNYVMHKVVDAQFAELAQDEHLWLKSTYIFIWPIVSLDETLIPRLGSCRAVDPSWSPLYGEKSWNVFLKNINLFSTEKRKTWTSWMTWRWENYQEILEVS